MLMLPNYNSIDLSNTLNATADGSLLPRTWIEIYNVSI